MSYRSILVALATVASTTAIGCAGGGGKDAATQYCESVLMTSPSCVSSVPPPPGGSNLQVPTGEIRPKMDGDSGRDFIAAVELVSLSPSAGVVQNATFRFSPSIRFRMDDLGLQNGNSINYFIYTSNDGVNKIAEIGNGYMYSPNYVDVFGTGGMFMMVAPFKYIIVEMKTTLNGQGTLWAQPVKFEVGYAR